MISGSHSRLLRSLARDGIEDRVLAAMAAVPRHEFIPDEERGEAYRDAALPIGHGQTISQPYIVGYMTEKLELLPHDRVLEIGTGSGYQAAVLSMLVAEVYTIEIIPALALQARERFRQLRLENVQTRLGDGSQGWPEAAPFDAVIVTCAPGHVPHRLVEQLRDGGRMIIPVGARGGHQELQVLHKHRDKVRAHATLRVRFVPMTGAVQDED